MKRGNWNVEKNGCLGIIAKDKKGKYVLSGFALNDKKNEATNAINAVIAKYGYTQGFLDVYDLVDAAFIHIHNKPEGTKLQIKKAVLSTALDRSEIAPPTNINIPQQNNLSSRKVNKSLTYSGHKLQGRTKLYGMDISIENKKGSYRCGIDPDGHISKSAPVRASI